MHAKGQRSIDEIEIGDYIKLDSGEFEQIARITRTPHPEGRNIPKKWLITTTTGREVGMLDVRSYHKKEDIILEPYDTL